MMTNEELVHAQVRAAIDALPPSDLKKVETIAETFRSIITQNEPHGRMALALVGSEEAAKPEAIN